MVRRIALTVVALAASTAPGQPRPPIARVVSTLSLESILQLDPDVIVDTVDMGAVEIDRERRTTESRQPWQGCRTIPAVRAGRARVAGTDALFISGDRVVDAAAWLADVIGGPVLP